jgi:hypothetical protein
MNTETHGTLPSPPIPADSNIIDFHAEHTRRKKEQEAEKGPHYCPRCVAQEAFHHVRQVEDAIDRADICNAVPTLEQLREWRRMLHVAATEIAAASRWTLAKVAEE